MKLIGLYRRGACIFACFFLFFISCSNEEHSSTANKQVTEEEKVKLYLYEQLDSCLEALVRLKGAVSDKELFSSYYKARKAFKKAEPILAFFDKNNYLSLNQPNILKVTEEDATDIKIMKPFGFQVVEELLQEAEINRRELEKEAEFMINRIKLVRNTISVKLKDYHLIWLIKDQLVRVASMGITGFDSPMQHSLEESSFTYQTLLFLLNLYEESFKNSELKHAWKTEVIASKKALEKEFNDFDRFEFIKNHIHPQLKLLNETAEDWNVNFPFEMGIRNNATSLFTDSTFNLDFFNDFHEDSKFSEQKVALGKKLFHDVNLSKGKQLSCGTCHVPNKAFTDGKMLFENQKRNTPTLTYAALQQEFFYDNRAGSLEGQIVSVVNNRHEFQSDLKTMVTTILADSAYNSDFKEIYGKAANDSYVRNAISSYVRSLNAFNSKFDKNINGTENSLTQEEKQGFNLFMGKAQCATCHFPPTFNGTLPPYFKHTEMELIGVPETKAEQKVDGDLGRYELFHTKERKHFFKTPTVRNSSLTAPYMHNGVYETLEEVVDFYNRGGGAGLGFDLPYQTLPEDSLQLSKTEIKAIVAFLHSLEDETFSEDND